MAIDLANELIELRRMILTMGAEVEQRMCSAINGLVHHDLELIRAVRTGDKEIDRMELSIEEECFKVLALSHPVAGDLRFVLAVLRINSNLERIADMVKGIAKRVIDIDEVSPIEIPAPIVGMAQEAQRMLSDALRALADHDTELARRVRRADDRVDDLQKEVFAWAQREITSDVEHTHGAIDFLSIARKLERIADVSTNIAEDVIFLSEGAILRHGHLADSNSMDK